MGRKKQLSVLLFGGLLAGCASHHHRPDGAGLGSVDGAYYDNPRGDADYAYDQRGVETRGYYDAGFPFGSRPYGYRPYYGRPYDHGRGGDRGGDHHDDHDDHAPGHAPDHSGGGDHSHAPVPAPETPAAAEPTYNDIRAGKANTNAHQNVGGNRSSNSGHSAGGKH